MEPISVEELLEMMEKHNPDVWHSDSDGGFGIKASQFKDFAIEDSKVDSLHARINALSNVKRAIECRIDEILAGLCLHVKSDKEQWSFPKKVKVLADLGIIAPRILEKINRQRNKLEHEYVEPTKEDVEDALDVAVLFLGYSTALPSVQDCIIKMSCQGHYIVNLSREKGFIRVIEEGGSERELKIGSDDNWLRMAKILNEPSMP